MPERHRANPIMRTSPPDHDRTPLRVLEYWRTSRADAERQAVPVQKLRDALPIPTQMLRRGQITDSALVAASCTRRSFGRPRRYQPSRWDTPTCGATIRDGSRSVVLRSALRRARIAANRKREAKAGPFTLHCPIMDPSHSFTEREAGPARKRGAVDSTGPVGARPARQK
jgi:hypothetical protein